MLGEITHLAAGEVMQIDVGITGGVGLDQRDQLLVSADVAGKEAAVILEEQAAGVAIDGIFVQIEIAFVALIGGNEEALLVVGKASELGLELVAGRQILDAAIQLTDIDMIELVAALIGGVEDASVVGEVTDRVVRIGGRLGQGRRFTTGGRHLIEIDDTADIGGEQHLAGIRRKVGTLQAQTGEQGVDIVLLDLACGLDRSRRWRGAHALFGRLRAGAEGADQQQGQQGGSERGGHGIHPELGF